MKIVPHTFQNRLNGLLGEFWKKQQMKEIEEVRKDIQEGRITFNDGVAYNCVGRVIMNDLAEVVEYIAPEGFSREATRIAREEEVNREIEEYRRNPPRVTKEDLLEMRAAFGPGQEVVDIFTGHRYLT